MTSAEKISIGAIIRIGQEIRCFPYAVFKKKLIFVVVIMLPSISTSSRSRSSSSIVRNSRSVISRA